MGVKVWQAPLDHGNSTAWLDLSNYLRLISGHGDDCT
jgi:hypothetical protein